MCVCVCAGTLGEWGIGDVIRQDVKSSWRQISGRACEEVSRLCLLRWEDPHKCGQHHPLGRSAGLNKKEKVS